MEWPYVTLCNAAPFPIIGDMWSGTDVIAAVLAGGLALSSPTPILAQTGEEFEADEIVDVELVLAVDVSLSMSFDELEIQRHGYAAALEHDRVIQAILDGGYGKIAVAYVEWAGDDTQRVVVPWTRIASADEARAFASRLTAVPPSRARRTSISGALRFAATLFDDNGYRGLKRVIDVSGDGPNNQGPPVHLTRDAVVATGITVNGLPLMTNDGLTTAFDVDDLDAYYTACVIGGAGAFMVPVNEWSNFPEAVRRKLVLELAGPAAHENEAPPVLLAAASAENYDCLIGERMWRNRSLLWDN